MSLFKRFEGTVYRGHHPAWAYQPESGEGAALYGGRFNRVGTPCLYTAMSIETAWLEAQQGFVFKAQPLTICAYAVDCADVIDLTETAVRKDAGIDLADLACDWELRAARNEAVSSWQVADHLIAAGCVGMIVPSFASRAGPRDSNLVLWKWARALPHKIIVIDDDLRLPRNQLSWQAL